MYADYVYEIVRKEAGKMDAIYEDFIIHLVGVCGLAALKERGLLEPCGILNGRQLYVMCEKWS